MSSVHKTKCLFYARGCCKNGRKCPFNHNFDPKEHILCCPYQNNCRYGKNCKFWHPKKIKRIGLRVKVPDSDRRSSLACKSPAATSVKSYTTASSMSVCTSDVALS